MGTLYEKMKAEKLAKDRHESAAHRVLGLTVTEYIRHKNPSTVNELEQLLKDMRLEDRTDIVKVYVEGVHPNGSPVYAGVKLKIRGAIDEYHPPGKEYIPIAREASLIDKQTLLIHKKGK